MKRLIILFILLLISFSLLACWSEQASWDALQAVDGGIPPTPTEWRVTP